MSTSTSVLPGLRAFRRNMLALAGLGTIAAIVGYVVDPTQFFHAYMFAYIFWVCLALGCLALTMLQHVVQASWGRPILRIFEAGNRTLFPMFLLFLPILITVWMRDPVLYHWVHPGEDPILKEKSAYLNPGFFTARWAIYFAIWIGLSLLLNKWSVEQDRTGDPTLAHKRINLSAPGMVVFVLTITFAFTDWVMSLDPHWYSTVYGLWFLIGQALAAMSMAVYIVIRWRGFRPFADLVTPQYTRDIGNMLLMMTMVWAYLTLSQFLIIWSGNLPEETTYYSNRGIGFINVWNLMGAFLVIFQFFVPFLLLLSGRTKRTPDYLIKVATWILFMRVVDMFWTIVPFFNEKGHQVGVTAAGFQSGFPLESIWLYVAAFLGMGGIWLSIFAGELQKHPLLARHQPEPGGAEVLEHA